MISRVSINERVREWGLREDVVEKDYVLGWLLWGIGSHPRLTTSWVFKGGTCLKKCYIETYRFSEDLDFSVTPGGPLQPEVLEPIMEEVLQRAGAESGIDFTVRPARYHVRPTGNSVEVRVYYRGPRAAPTPGSIKLDLTGDEAIVRPTVLRAIAHAHQDELPSPGRVRCYSFEEVFAEKLRAMGERCRPRDLYDIVNLYRRRDLRAEGQLIRSVLVQKCESKGVEVPSLAALQASPYLPELQSEWANMLSHQLPTLPPFEAFWEELPGLFGWLEGTSTPEILETIGAGKDENLEWVPPPTVWTWGQGVPLETIRFAGSNYLCVRLGYGGTERIIEPYSLRRTREGAVLLYAVKADTREPRSYRVDRMQSAVVTTRAFRPTFAVEFSQAGPLIAPTTADRAGWQGGSPIRGRSTRSSRPAYVIECPRCERQFRRVSPDTKLRPHKSKDGWPCLQRFGRLVR